MTPTNLDRGLRQTFRFEAADLAANREGRVSPRQAALLRASRAGMWLSLGVFTAVMLGSVGLVAFFNWRLDTPGGWGSGVGVAAAVAVVVVAIGYVASRRHLSAARSRQLSVARGPVAVLSETEGNCRVRIGGTALRLPGVDSVEAFQPGAEYRVYYLAGPVALVLSAEALSGGDSPGPDADAGTEDDEHAAASAQIVVVRRGYLVVVVLGLLALGIPVAGSLVGDLPSRFRPLAWIGLFVVAVGFAWLAVSWLTSGPRRRA